MKSMKVTISGNVTGVFFRDFIKSNAINLNLKGFVRNVNEKVEAIFEGEEKSIKKMIELCKKGPEGSKVTDIKIKKEQIKNEFKDFKVIH